jgi:hypothetical protein
MLDYLAEVRSMEKFFEGFEVRYVPLSPGFKAKLNANSMCAQESSLHTYRIENGYRITNVTI